MTSKLLIQAKDVKIQVEFNPEKVQSYRLIGYENRILQKEDFNDDKKDAGEMGAGHTVTALYEIIPAGVKDVFSGKVDELKYQTAAVSKNEFADEMLTVKLRYKTPTGDESKLMVHTVADENTAIENTSDNFRFSAAVASFGMLLRNSAYTQQATYEEVIRRAKNAKGKDLNGYRNEFIELVQSAATLALVKNK